MVLWVGYRAWLRRGDNLAKETLGLEIIDVMFMAFGTTGWKLHQYCRTVGGIEESLDLQEEQIDTNGLRIISEHLFSSFDVWDN